MKLEHHELLSTFAFNFNLRRYNAYDIVSELSEYVTDVDAAISRESVRAVGRVCTAARHVIHHMVYRCSTRHPPHSVPALTAPSAS